MSRWVGGGKWASWFFGVALLGCAGEGGGTAPTGGDAYAPATPGTCSGTAAPCELPAAESLDALLDSAPLLTTEESEVAPGEILWEVPLGSVECPIGDCEVAYASVFAADDGSVWVSGSLRAPGSEFAPLPGTALLRFDAEGHRTFGIVADYRPRIAGGASGAPELTSAEGGHVLWLGPLPNEPGMELREYDLAGAIVQRWPLVRGSPSAYGVGQGAGAAFLIHQYDRGIAGLPGGTEEPEALDFDVSRFEPPGGAVWNFTASAAFGTDLRRLGAVLLRDELFLLGDIVPKLEPRRSVLTAMNGDGRATRRFETTAYSVTAAHRFESEGVLLSLSATSPLDPTRRALALDVRGTPLWRADETSVVVAQDSWTTDRDGRAWSLSSFDERLSIAILSRDARRCATSALDVNLCTKEGTTTVCGGMAFAPASGGRVFFSRASSIGLARFPEVP